MKLDCPYTPTVELLDSFNCDFYMHGDDIAVDVDGSDITTVLDELGRFKVFKRSSWFAQSN